MKKVIFLILIVLLADCGGIQTYEPINSPAAAILSTRTATQTETNTPAATSSDMPTPKVLPMPTPLHTLQPNQTITLSNLHMLDATTGWGIALGGRIMRTTDGGILWNDVTPKQSNYTDGGFYALDAENAWAISKVGEVRNGQLPSPIWHTSDGGKTWQQPESPSSNSTVPYYTPTKVIFTNPQTGWILWDTSQDQIHSVFTYLERTTDGGKSWEETEISTTPDLYTGLIFLDNEVGYAGARLALDLTYYGTPTSQDYVEGKSLPELWKTTDGGKTWSMVQLPRLNPIPAELQAIVSSNDQMSCGVIGLIYIPPAGILVKVQCTVFSLVPPIREMFNYGYLSADMGQTWHSWLAGTGEQFINITTGWRLYSPGKDMPNQLQQTTDGGLTWVTIKNVAWQSAQFDFINISTGWALATDNKTTALVYTNDGGKTWKELTPSAVP